MNFLTLSLTAIQDLIIEPEISSKNNYENKLQRPTWPGGVSGLTVGIGYDLGMNTAAQILKDWTGIVLPFQIRIMQKYAGKVGVLCRKLLPVDLVITFDEAVKCFFRTTLSRYAGLAAKVYPNLENLHPYEQTAIVGLVYNRGNGLVGPRREEMAELIAAIKEDNDKKMAAIIRKMKRLWGPDLPGLGLRRELEAYYIEMPDNMPLAECDLVKIPF